MDIPPLLSYLSAILSSFEDSSSESNNQALVHINELMKALKDLSENIDQLPCSDLNEKDMKTETENNTRSIELLQKDMELYSNLPMFKNRS